MKVIYSIAFGVGAFFALNCGDGDGYGSSTGGSSTGGSPAAPAPSGTATAAPASDAVVEVKVNGGAFDPPEVKIKANQTVRWVWASGRHNVVSGASCTPDGKFNSGNTVSAPATFERKFTETGAFPYFCDPHCSMGMTGTVTVE
jgi:plastocyanin